MRRRLKNSTATETMNTDDNAALDISLTLAPDVRFDSAFSRVKDTLLSEMNAQVFNAYIKPLCLGACDEERRTFEILAPSKLLLGQIEANFIVRIQQLFAAELGFDLIDIKLIIGSPDLSANTDAHDGHYVVKRVRVGPTSAPSSTPAEENFDSPDKLGSGLNSKYTFLDFVVGNSNQFCHAAAMRVAERPGQSYNPLFIYGGVGLGKTHLLHAIGNEARAKNPSARVLYISSETFTNELILALRNAKMEEFKRRMRAIEVLLIDDIQFIAGKERTQEEFFHTFNALYGAKRQIVLTSDKIPTEIPGIEERLQTRFSWGLTADLQAPDFETRVAILKQKAQLEGFDLPEDVAHFVAEHISSNVRELEGALTRVNAMSSIRSIPLSLEMAKDSLKHLLQPKVIQVSVLDIQKAVSLQFGIKVTEMTSKRRTKNLSFPRHIAMYLSRKHTTSSYPEIGELFGGRDHSSVIHAATVVSSKISTDVNLRGIIEEIERKLLS